MKILLLIEQHARTILFVLIAMFVMLVSAVITWKYNNFLYTGLDLAIFSQTFWNTVHGRLFENSIQGSLYLGDHFTPTLTLLLPIYALLPDPRLLLFAQTTVLALTAWPLWLLAKQLLNSIKYPKTIALVIASAYLLNPFVLNAAVFEFHALPFFLFPLFFALYFAARDWFWISMLCLLVAMGVREDISLVSFSFGVGIWSFIKNESKKMRWLLVPMTMSVIWFVCSLLLIGHFSPASGYKFALFYTTNTIVGDPLVYLATNPLILVKNFVAAETFIVFAGLLTPFAWLPLLSGTGLSLTVLPFLQFTTTIGSGLEVLVLHYGLFFLPGLFLATIMTIKKTARLTITKWRNILLPKDLFLYFSLLLLSIATVYTTIFLGPGEIIFAMQQLPADKTNEKIITELREKDRIVSSRALLASLTNREHLYPLVYVMRGTLQLSDKPYPLPTNIDALIIDQTDLFTRLNTVKNNHVGQEDYKVKAGRLQALIANEGLHAQWTENGRALLTKAPGTLTLFQKTTPHTDYPIAVTGSLSLHVQTNQVDDRRHLTFLWHATSTPTHDYVLQLNTKNAAGTILKHYYFEPSWGLSPSSTWQQNETYASTFVLRDDKAVAVDISLLHHDDVRTAISGPLRSSTTEAESEEKLLTTISL